MLKNGDVSPSNFYSFTTLGVYLFVYACAWVCVCVCFCVCVFVGVCERVVCTKFLQLKLWFCWLCSLTVFFLFFIHSEE